MAWPEVIKLEFTIRLKIKRYDWVLADTSSASSQSLRFIESDTVLKFYNLEAGSSLGRTILYNRGGGGGEGALELIPCGMSLIYTKNTSSSCPNTAP